ncbi:hypothetical protein VKT23_010607 [Stygiomarasmius scandens]|uniref:SH3 domain-containing protein n=1 Tax=Marasmiellus scandens TaxID=2682957 RepID=A0ABR1JAR9_9AGAR
MDAAQLSRWTRFAAKGGIGKCTATQDCIAEGEGDLMFMKDDVITVLMQTDVDGVFLGYCEGVVGHFQSQHVQFHSKLKRPVMTKRNSSASRPSSSSGIAQTKSPTPSMFSAVTASPTPGTPPTPNANGASPNTPNTPVTPNTPSYTSGGDGRRASVVYTGEPLTVSASTSSSISAASDVEEPRTHVPTNSVTSFASSVSSKYSTPSHYSSPSVQSFQSLGLPNPHASPKMQTHSPSPSMSSVSTVHTTHTTHTFASASSARSGSTLDVDYGLPRTTSPYSMSSLGHGSGSGSSHGHGNWQQGHGVSASVSSTGSAVHLPTSTAEAVRPKRQDSIGTLGLGRNPSTSMKSLKSVRSMESFQTADTHEENSYLDEGDVDEGDFKMVAPHIPGSLMPGGRLMPPAMSALGFAGVHAPGMERSISASTSAGSGSAGSVSASTSGSGSGYGVAPIGMSRSISTGSAFGITVPPTLDPISPSELDPQFNFEPQRPAPVPPSQPPPAPQTKPPQLNRSTSQKSVASVASAVSATSDGEVGIGLSLMASLGGDDSEDDSEYGGGDETVRMEGKFDDDDEGGLSYDQSQSQFALLSSSTSANSSAPFDTPTTPHFNPQQTSKPNIPNPISTLGHSQLRSFSSSASTPQYQSQTPSPALSTHSAVSASQSVRSHAISEGESSTYSHSTSEGGGGRGLDSPIAAFPRPPAANEMEVRRLSLMMQQQQQQQGQQMQQMSQEVLLPTIQPQQRNLGSAMGGRSFGAASTASVSSWGSIGRAAGIHSYLVLSLRINYYTSSLGKIFISKSTKPFAFSAW